MSNICSKNFIRKNCVLEDKPCNGCGECMFCDLDPTKICDNCGKCIDFKNDITIKIDGFYEADDEKKS